MTITTIQPVSFAPVEFDVDIPTRQAVRFKCLVSGYECRSPDPRVAEEWAKQRKRDAAALDAYTQLGADNLDDVQREDTRDMVILTLGDQVVQVAV